MSNIDDLIYKGEDVIINGKKRKLLYTNKGMKILAKEFGTVYKALNAMQKLNFEFDEDSLEKIAILLFAGLIHEDQSLTIDDVDNMLRFDLLPYFIEKISKAITGSLPQPKKTKTQSSKKK